MSALSRRIKKSRMIAQPNARFGVSQGYCDAQMPKDSFSEQFLTPSYRASPSPMSANGPHIAG
jgi:hypothetical protein